MRIRKEIFKKLISSAKKKDVYLVIRCQDYKSRSLNVKNGKVDGSQLIEVKGTGIQAFTKSGHMGFASVDTISNEKRLLQCLEAAIRASETAQKQKFEAIKEVFKLEPIKDKVIQKVQIDPFKISNQELQKNLLAFHKQLVKKNPDFSISNSASFSDDHWRIFRSDDTDIEFKVSNSALVSLIHIAVKDNINQVYEASCSFGYEVLRDKSKLIFHKKKLYNKLKHIINYVHARTLKAGKYPILLDGAIAGIFIHEAFGHTAESDNVYQGSPLLKKGRVNKGKKVAKTFVNVFDYATKYDRGFYPYSSYGVKRKKAQIVKRGKINSLLSDVMTAEITNSMLTGAARVDSYSSIPFPRMSSTQIRLDKKHTIFISYNHLAADIKKIHKTLKKYKIFQKYSKIIYLMGSRGGQVDQQKGNFQFGSVVSFKLTKDSITLLKPVSFSGLTLKALSSVELAFGDAVTFPGVCGKWGQRVIMSAKAPMLLLSPNKHVTIG